MKIDVNKEVVKQNIFEAINEYIEYVESFTTNIIVQMSAKKHYPSSKIRAEELVKHLLQRDIAFCVKMMNHNCDSITFESAPYVDISQKLLFPDIEFGMFVDDPIYKDYVRDSFNNWVSGKESEDCSLANLIVPKILEKTPYYDTIPTYYRLLFQIMKNTTIVDGNLTKAEFEGLYNFSNYINIDIW